MNRFEHTGIVMLFGATLLVAAFVQIGLIFFPLVMTQRVTLPLGGAALVLSVVATVLGRRLEQPERARLVHVLVWTAWANVFFWQLAAPLAVLACVCLVVPASLRWCVLPLPMLATALMTWKWAGERARIDAFDVVVIIDVAFVLLFAGLVAAYSPRSRWPQRRT